MTYPMRRLIQHFAQHEETVNNDIPGFSIFDAEGYTILSEGEERMAIIDAYMICTVGITLAIIILFSLINTNKKFNKSEQNNQSSIDDIDDSEDNGNKYYKSAIICGILSTVSAILFYLGRFVSTDLMFPIDINGNIDMASLLDSWMLIFWTIEKIAFYFGFTYIYLSLFQKDSIDILLRISMVFMTIGTVAYVIYYVFTDVITTDLSEISFGSKRGIYAVLIVNADVSVPAFIVMIAGFVIDACYVILLIYRFSTRGSGHTRAKAILLLSISSLVWVGMWIVNMTNSEIKFVVDSLPILVDNVCLYLMFNDHQSVYDNLCGCLFCGVGSKYKRMEEEIDVSDNDDQQGIDDDESNQQLV